MLLTTIPSYQNATNSSPIPAAIEYQSNKTINSEIPKQTQLPKTTLPLGENTKEEITETYFSYPPIQAFVKRSYSDTYIQFNTQSFVNSLMTELNEWEENGTENSISHIANIRQHLNNFSIYLEQRPEQRIMLSLLELIFENNQWENMDQKDVKKIKEEVKRFSSGQLDWKSLKTFSRQLYNNKLSILQKDEKEA